MELLVGFLSVLLISAFIVDWMLKDEAIISLSSDLKKFSSQTDEFTIHQQIGFVNKQFCLIFDAIYGQHTWSWKRLLRSTALSLFFVLFSVLLIGIENTYLAPLTKSYVRSHNIEQIIILSLMFGCYNIAIDFISLLETRWVMGRAQNAGTITLAKWVVVDLFLTSAIYTIFLGFVLTIVAIFNSPKLPNGLYSKIFSMLIDKNFWLIFFSPNIALPFFISTFGTSIVWYMFVFFTFCIKSLRRSQMFKIVLDKISMSATPAYITVVTFSLPVVIVFGVFESIKWLISN